MNIKRNCSSLWQRLNETQITLTPTTGITIVLSVLAALPMLVSVTFPYISGNVRQSMIKAAVMYVFGNYWRDSLYVLGALCALLALWFWGRTWKSGGPPQLNRDTLKGRGLPLFLALMLAWSLLSALSSSSRYISFFGTAYRQEGVITYLVYASIFSAALLLSERQMHIVSEILCAVCAGTGVLVLLPGETLHRFFEVQEDLRALMFHQYNHYGYFLGLCLPLCVGLILADDRPSWILRLIRMGEFWLICNAVAFNSVRGSFLAIALVMVMWNAAVLLTHRGRWQRMLLLDVVFASTILWLNTGSTLLDRMDVLFEQLDAVRNSAQTVQEAVAAPAQDAAATAAQATPNANSALDDLGSERGLLWRLGIRFAAERPLFGYGPENLGFLYTEYKPGIPDRPHNELIQFAASLGLPALGFYLAGMGCHLAAFLRRFKKLSLFQLGLFACEGSYLIGSLFGNTMYYTTPYFYMVLAFSYSVCRKIK